MGNHALSQLEIVWFTIIKGKNRDGDSLPTSTKVDIKGKKNRGGDSLPTSTKVEVKIYFRKFDTDGDGRLSCVELKNVFKMLCVKAHFREALQAINPADSNGDFCITEDELDVLAEFVLERGISIPSSFHA